MNKRILGLAVPSIISNITVPLLGLVDVSIVGHLGSATYIGAIAVGGMLFSMIYWIFGFLRMGTSGLTAQAYGRRDLAEVILSFVRSVGIAFGLGLLLILLQYPILKVAFTLIDATPTIKELASLYFRICIWGAPAVLGLYSFAGWFVGMQNSRFPMYIAITQNVVNIAASLFFVFVWNRGVAGVAMGTLVAQYAGLLMASLLWYGYYRRLWPKLNWKMLTDYEAMRSFFILNRDIFFRTLCLVAVTTYFTSRGAEQGDVILAVNTLLMQLFTLYSYIMDGFAYAGEALTGRYVGAHNRADLERMIRALFAWGIGLALTFTLLIWYRRKFVLRFADERTRSIKCLFRLFLLGVGYSLSRYGGLFMGWNLYWCYSFPSDAVFDVGCFSFILPFTRIVTATNGKPCFVDGIYRLFVLAWVGTNRTGTKDSVEIREVN